MINVTSILSIQILDVQIKVGVSGRLSVNRYSDVDWIRILMNPDSVHLLDLEPHSRNSDLSSGTAQRWARVPETIACPRSSVLPLRSRAPAFLYTFFFAF